MPSRVIQLPSGIEFSDPLELLTPFFAEEYAYYDAIPSADPNRIDPLDILATVSMNSFVNSADKVRSIHKGLSAACDPILAEIPPDADLLDPGVDLDAVERLLDAACRVKGVLLAVATKVLHRKRRALIPMLDSVVNEHYLENIGHRGLFGALGDGTRAGAAGRVILEAFRADLRAVHTEIEVLRRDLAAEGYDLTPVRILEVLLWVHIEPRGYYR